MDAHKTVTLTLTSDLPYGQYRYLYNRLPEEAKTNKRVYFTEANYEAGVAQYAELVKLAGTAKGNYISEISDIQTIQKPLITYTYSYYAGECER